MPKAHSPTQPSVVIVDKHAISRAACRALLLTEGVAVVADIDGDDDPIKIIRTLAPDVVIVDVSHGSPRGIELARRLRDTPGAPSVVATSCDCCPAVADLSGLTFIPKADLDAASLTAALGRR